MRPATAEKLAWILIYSGLLLGVLGLFMQREGSPLGLALTIAGALDAVCGVLMIWLRSRMPPTEDKETP